MSRPFEVHLPLEGAYLRNVLFAVEVLDAVTLARVSQGLKVVADGLRGTPKLNASGLFVWLEEDIAPLRKITIDPRMLPHESAELTAEQLRLPMTTIELPPRLDYPFAPGITGLRGTLMEERAIPPNRPVPVADAEVRLHWLDDDGTTWHNAPTASHANPNGDFAAIVRLAPADVPRLDANGAFTVRLSTRRAGQNERSTADFPLLLGRVADALTFAWDELQP